MPGPGPVGPHVHHDDGDDCILHLTAVQSTWDNAVSGYCIEFMENFVLFWFIPFSFVLFWHFLEWLKHLWLLLTLIPSTWKSMHPINWQINTWQSLLTTRDNLSALTQRNHRRSLGNRHFSVWKSFLWFENHKEARASFPTPNVHKAENCSGFTFNAGRTAEWQD